ncbi:MAG: DUF6156 family protein [Methylobacter tundripaludum]|jgi:hypothetical protein|nr:DUF6156 family protein [Methylobacter tundripaludum]
MESQNLIKYFESWSGYNIPFKPIRETTLERALSLKAYYIGTYRQSRLITFEKILDNKREWIDVYEYWENSQKLRKRTMTKASGEVLVQNFDKNGNTLAE